MTSFSSAAATTISMATIGSGERDTADRGPTWRLKGCLRASEGTRGDGCVNSESENTGCTKFRDRTSEVGTSWPKTKTEKKNTTDEAAAEVTTSTNIRFARNPSDLQLAGAVYRRAFPFCAAEFHCLGLDFVRGRT